LLLGWRVLVANVEWQRPNHADFGAGRQSRLCAVREFRDDHRSHDGSGAPGREPRAVDRADVVGAEEVGKECWYGGEPPSIHREDVKSAAWKIGQLPLAARPGMTRNSTNCVAKKIRYVLRRPM
jgi:hypothetical protein